jgi:menaquinone-dependent protoporphyrinogen oxidase
MIRRILVAYGTKSGSTAEVAEAIGRALSGDGVAVDVRRAADVSSIDDYDAVVLGGPVVSPAWHPDAIDFLERFHRALAPKPVAWFFTSMTLTQSANGRVGTIPIFQDPAHTRAARRVGTLGLMERMRTPEAYLEPVLRKVPDVVPIQVAFLAGRLDYGTLDLITRTLIRYVVRIPAGDLRNSFAIQTWAEDLRGRLWPARSAGEERLKATA